MPKSIELVINMGSCLHLVMSLKKKKLITKDTHVWNILNVRVVKVLVGSKTLQTTIASSSLNKPKIVFNRVVCENTFFRHTFFIHL